MRKKYDINCLKTFAKRKGGECLSNKYINSKHKYKWRCELGHIWNARWEHVNLAGSWCPCCSGNKGDFLGHAKAIAKERGGKLISKAYKKSTAKLKWQCSSGHVFQLNLNNAKNGQWCGVCASGISERICRTYLESLTGRKFSKSHPKWLKNRKEHQLELDGYNSRIGLAFEHQGVQHFEHIRHFHGLGQSTLSQIKANDSGIFQDS